MKNNKIEYFERFCPTKGENVLVSRRIGDTDGNFSCIEADKCKNTACKKHSESEYKKNELY